MKDPGSCLADLKSRRDLQCWWAMWTVLAISWIVMFFVSIGFTAITAKYPIWDPILINADNLTFPRFCFRALENSATINTITCVFCNDNGTTVKMATGLGQSGGQCWNHAADNSCYCFNNYAFLEGGGKSAIKYAFPTVGSRIGCSMNISICSALMWLCDPDSKGNCGDAYGNPYGSNIAPIAAGYHTFVGLLPSIIHNANGTYNSTDYVVEKSIHPLEGEDPRGATMAVMHMVFTSFRIFHYFPVDEFNSFRWLIFMSSLTFFYMCLHNLAWLIFKNIIFRSSPINAGWGPVEAVGSSSVRQASASAPAPPPIVQPEGHKGYNTL